MKTGKGNRKRGLVQRGQGVPAFWFARAIETGGQEVLAEPFRSSVWVQAAIKKVAGPISAVPLEFYPRAKEVTGEGRSEGRGRGGGGRWGRIGMRARTEEALSLPGVEQFLRNPMAGMGYADFVEAAVGWLKLAGECFFLIGDDDLMTPFPEARQKAPTIVMARPDRMRQVVEGNELVGWEYRDGQAQKHTLLPEQVIQVKCWNPYDRWRGLGEYEAAQIATEGDWLAGKFARNLMANNGDTGPYIVAKGGIPDDFQREQILADLRAKRQAQQRGDFKPMFLAGDISVEDPQMRSVDASFTGQRLENRHEIFIAFGVPPSMADVKAAYSIGSASDFYQLIANTCVPMGAKFADGIERLVLALFRLDVEAQLGWDEHPVFQEVRKERLASIDTLWSKGMPMQAISDYLGLGLPKFAGWEQGYVRSGAAKVGGEKTEDGGQKTEDSGEKGAGPEGAGGKGEEGEPPEGGTTNTGKPGSGEEGNEDEKKIEAMMGALEGRRSGTGVPRSDARSDARARAVQSKIARCLHGARSEVLRSLGEGNLRFDLAGFSARLISQVREVVEMNAERAAGLRGIGTLVARELELRPGETAEYWRGFFNQLSRGVARTVARELSREKAQETQNEPKGRK